MNQTTSTPAFTSSDGLRDLLQQFDTEAKSWSSVEANDLMSFCMTKYAALARKHGLEPSDAAVAAFEVMRTRAARDAADPWAVVTRAVQLTLMYDARANGLLCSTARARRAEYKGYHDAERFSDRETPLHEYHPAFHLEAGTEDESDNSDDGHPTSAFEAADRAVETFALLGWPAETARVGIDYICDRLSRTGDRAAAYESLRRDDHARALLDLDQRCWLAMLKGALGIQHQDRAHTNAGRGMLLLFLIGHQVADVLCMPDITGTISRGSTTLIRERHHG